jgi:hypothetical protein
MNMKCTLLFVSLTALILMPAASNAQCPSGCNPLSGGYFISYVPQCYGENYQVTFQAAFEYAYDCNGGWWPWYTNNFTFSADFNTTYCATLYSTCYSSSPFQYCCDWDINNNCIQYCLDCNTSSYQIQQTTQVTTGSAPICNISVSATKTDASGFGLGCSPGSITVSASTNACNGWYAFIERLNDEFGPQTFSGYVDSSNPTLGGLQNGTYLITAYSNPGGCQATTSIIVGQNNCQMDVSTSVNNPLIAGCNNGEIKISAITNNCQGYQSTLMTTDSVTVTSCISVSGDTCSFLFLPPGNYLIKTTDYPYALSSCTRWNAITIADAPCVSPWTISATSASGYGCNDGSFTIRDTTTNCTNFSPVSIYQFNKQNYYTYLYLFNYIDKEFNYPGWPPGWYFFNATAGYTNYYGQYISCDIWDSIYIEPSCILTTSYFTSPASVTGCPNGEINVTATTNACSGYTADILSTTDSSTIFAQQTAASGVAINWNTVPPGNYLVRIRTNPFYDTLCEEIIPITIADAPCVSPWTISATSASGYGCYDGSFTIRDTTTNCTNFSTVSIYQFNKQNYYTYLYLANYPDKEFNYPGLPPGWYFFNATAGYTNYYGQYISCDIWDSVYIAPSCSIQTTYNIVSGCGVSILASTSITNSCNGHLANLSDSAGNLLYSIYNTSGVTTFFNNLIDGTYILTITSIPQGCQTTDTMQVTADIPNIYFADNDGDNFGNPALSTFACTAPIGYVTDSTDCDDTNPGVNPLASEINNGIDDNCNGNTDEFTSITLHLKIYIEGYYLGNGVMSAVLDPFTLPNICDSITVVLREPIAPFSPIHSTSSIIDINGNGVFNFPAAVNNQLYYIEVINRNTIATWSKLPILFDSPVLNYDFTD